MVRSKILSEVRKARFYSILADEVSSHDIEHLCLYLRFVDMSHIREEFITFLNELEQLILRMPLSIAWKDWDCH